MKVESLAILFITICIFLSFYFAFLSFQTIDDALKKQLVTFAASSLLAGGMILACMTIYLGFKKAFSHLKDQLGRSKGASKITKSKFVV